MIGVVGLSPGEFIYGIHSSEAGGLKIYMSKDYFLIVSYHTKLLKLKDIASWGEISCDNSHPLLKDLELGIGATGSY